MSDESSPESISSRSLRNRKIMLAAMISFLVLIPLLFLALVVDFGRWTAQWQVWWGLRQAEETAVTRATIISFYQEDEDNFIHYWYSTPNGQQYEKTEQVKNSIYRQAEAGELLMVDFAIDNPSIAGIMGNIDPFSGPITILVVVGLLMIGMAGKRRRYSAPPSLLKKVATPDTTSEAPSIPPGRKASWSWPGIKVILIALFLLIFQILLIILLMTE
jgi:hypothetical protein